MSFLDGINIDDIAPTLHLNVDEYNRMLWAHGSGAEWRRSILCPCVRIDTRTPRANCDHCRGRGHIYPVEQREPLVVLDASRMNALKRVAAGLMAEGQVMVTLPCGKIPGQHDIFLMEGEFHVVQEHLFREGTRRLDDADHLRAARAAYSGDRPAPQRARIERLIYNDQVCIEAVYWEDEDRNLHQARMGTDFCLGPENRWEWFEGSGPPPGQAWTVRYRASAAYLVQGAGPLLRRENNENMPYRVVAQRLDRVSPDDLR